MRTAFDAPLGHLNGGATLLSVRQPEVCLYRVRLLSLSLQDFYDNIMVIA